MANEDKEIHILLSDQKMINKFARLNSRLEDFKDEIKSLNSSLETLEDADLDINMMEDPDEKVHFQIGEVFLLMTQDEISEALDQEKEKLNKQKESINSKMEEIKSAMSDLKTNLYAKFGNSINLEADED